MRNAPLQLGVVVGFTIISPILIYILAFYRRGISTDPEAWSQFANYIAGTVGVMVAAANGVLVLYIAGLARRWQQTDEQRGMAFDAHREWMSLEMYTSRTKAHEFLKAHPTETLDVLEKVHAQHMVDLWVVSVFSSD